MSYSSSSSSSFQVVKPLDLLESGLSPSLRWWFTSCVSRCPSKVFSRLELDVIGNPKKDLTAKDQAELVWSYDPHYSFSASSSSSLRSRSITAKALAFSTSSISRKNPQNSSSSSSSGSSRLGGVCVANDFDRTQGRKALATWSVLELRASHKLILLSLAASIVLSFICVYAMRLMLKTVLVVGTLVTVASFAALAAAMFLEASRIRASTQVQFALEIATLFDALCYSCVFLSVSLAIAAYLSRGFFLQRVASFMKIATRVIVLAPSSAFAPTIISILFLILLLVVVSLWCACAFVRFDSDFFFSSSSSASSQTSNVFQIRKEELGWYRVINSSLVNISCPASNFPSSLCTVSTVTSTSSSSSPLSTTTSTSERRQQIESDLQWATLALLLVLLLFRNAFYSLLNAILAVPAFFWLSQSSTTTSSCSSSEKRGCHKIVDAAHPGYACWRLFGISCMCCCHVLPHRGTDRYLPEKYSRGISNSNPKRNPLGSILVASFVHLFVDELALLLSCIKLLTNEATSSFTRFSSAASVSPCCCCCSSSSFCINCNNNNNKTSSNSELGIFVKKILKFSSIFDSSCLATGISSSSFSDSVDLIEKRILDKNNEMQPSVGAAAAPLKFLVGCEIFIRVIAAGIAAGCTFLCWFFLDPAKYPLFFSEEALLFLDETDQFFLSLRLAPLVLVFFASAFVAVCHLSVFPNTCRALVLAYFCAPSFMTRDSESDRSNSIELASLFERIDGVRGFVSEFDNGESSDN